MDAKYEQAKKVVEKYGQEHLLQHYDQLTKENKEKLIKQILSIDFEQLNHLYQEIGKEKKQKTKEIIEPIEYLDKSRVEPIEKKQLDQVGSKVIQEGKLAAVTMAGGQGTRLGFNGPKGTYNIGLNSEKTLFEILCDSLKEANQQYKTTVPWYIMTSEENNKDTVDFFEKHHYFDYPKDRIVFFKQGKFPMIDTKGKILLDENGLVKEAADGHGGVYIAMQKNKILDDMKKKGIEWIFIGGIDNILAKMVDPTLVGLAVKKNVMAAGKSVVKAYPEEKVGVFCKRNGKPSVIEYTELPKEMAVEKDKNGELKYGESHILCNLFNLKSLEEISKNILPYHPAFKKANYMDANGNIVKATEPNAYKFEAFLFDAFEELDHMAILRVKREEEFAPVKNADEKGVDCPKTARELYLNYQNKKEKQKKMEDMER